MSALQPRPIDAQTQAAEEAAARRLLWEQHQRELDEDRAGLIRGIQSALTLAGMCVIAVIAGLWILRGTP
jgi:hypothetical protein